MDNPNFYALELALAQAKGAQGQALAAALLDADFKEIGASGRIYNKEKALEVIGARPGQEHAFTNFCCVALCDSVALVTYESGNCLRSSLWRKQDMNWQMILHQGTKKAPPRIEQR